MNEVGEFFRHCPACGRRFHIKLINEKLLDERKEVAENRRTTVYPASFRFTPYQVILEESKPIVVDVKNFQYSYRCKHCGHQWSETHTEQTKK